MSALPRDAGAPADAAQHEPQRERSVPDAAAPGTTRPATVRRRSALVAAQVSRVARSALVPAAGVLYAVLWIVAEWSRADVDGVVVVLLLGTAIGLAAWMPSTALGLVTVVPVLQVVGLLAPPESTSWPEYLAIPVVAGVVGAGRSDLLRFVTVPAAAVASAAAAWAMTVPTAARPDVWGSWVGQGDGGSTRSDLVTVALALVGVAGIGWAVGVAVGSAWRLGLTRGRLSAAEQDADEAASELRSALDRAAIARDVHDSLAHSLAVVVSQAQGAAAVVAHDPTASRALDDIAAVGREALTDVRSLVERIEDDRLDDDPGRHGVADVHDLVARLRDVGMVAALETHGDAVPLTAAVDTAVHRIVQESCTNALKHAGRRATVRVTLDWRGPGVALLVESRGPVSSDVGLPQSPGTGAGIRGMRERARLVGGWLRAEQDPEDTDAWIVTAWLPAAAAPAGDARPVTRPGGTA